MCVILIIICNSIINGYILLYHTADHGCRVPMVNRYVKLSFNSTLEGSVLTLICENEKLMSTTNAADEQILKVICHSNTTNWNPDPNYFIESCSMSSFTITLPGTKQHTALQLAGIQKCPLSAYAWRQLHRQ